MESSVRDAAEELDSLQPPLNIRRGLRKLHSARLCRCPLRLRR